ncbi:hypothetical protein [Pseudochrobactrum sp. HB0163]|uniref:hypothetical protein n=1 Tax=Pseudochrobactrum sp. HB0163 TaxID=3450708 RepID=UPI003F6DB62D
MLKPFHQILRRENRKTILLSFFAYIHYPDHNPADYPPDYSNAKLPRNLAAEVLYTPKKTAVHLPYFRNPAIKADACSKACYYELRTAWGRYENGQQLRRRPLLLFDKGELLPLMVWRRR